MITTTVIQKCSRMVLNIKRSSSLDDADNDSDVLTPFPHQVGGHTPFTCLPNGHLLKPCDEREIFFYHNMPKDIRSIAPVCCSTIQGHSFTSHHDCCSVCMATVLSNLVIPKSIEGSPILKKRKLSRNFIVIGDITHGMRSPCVLDLKLGTRQHGDGASPQKAHGQIAKCLATTSATMGIRLCGMKYFGDNGCQVVVNKYDGRAMDESHLTQAIYLFFHSFPRAVTEVRRRIAEIKSVLVQCPGLRLFGASLLVAIEAEPLPGDFPSSLAKVCIVDFANATFPGFLVDNLYDGIDDGSILGLDTLDHLLMNI